MIRMRGNDVTRACPQADQAPSTSLGRCSD
jgi:hypothetical protein